MHIKWIATIVGALLGGGIFGGLIGYGIGSVIDGLINKEYNGVSREQGDFVISFLLLFAKVMKADGKVMRSELDFVRLWLDNNLGQENTQNRIELLKEFLSKDIDLNQVCSKINFTLNYASRVQLLHSLYGIALSDGDCSKEEKATIELIASLMRISEQDYKTVEAMYYKNNDSSYVILQVDKNASEDEIKKAYKRLCLKYHPDRVASLGEKAQQIATQKFQEINLAYESIKKERNFS
ncbi:MAG: TerB family tellurite resistance protein [Bacteroidales bacterium]|jgi:DnaJ like chaperone protein|nr:TerB family tellurite resistance protein [Bacteroidales bacterium]